MGTGERARGEFCNRLPEPESGSGLGCVKTPKLNLRTEFRLDFNQFEKQNAGDGCRDKTIEKTILRAFRARTFSRSQGHSRRVGPQPMTSGLPP
jgi:hypothetical protein